MLLVVSIFSVDGELSSLSESLCAPVYSTYERLCSSMSILMLLQILGQSECLLAVRTDVLLFVEMAQIVSLERELARAEFLTVSDVALIHFLSHCSIISIFNTHCLLV